MRSRVTGKPDDRLDVLASEPQFADHLAPVWEALPRDHRGAWLTAASTMLPYLRAKGYMPVMAQKGGARPVLVASISDLNRTRRMGRTRVAYMEHGAGQSYGGDRRTARHHSYAGGPGREHCGLIMAPNEPAAARWREAYPSVPVHVIGVTRVLPAPSGPPLLCVSFHWNGGMPEMKNAFGHFWPHLKRLAQVVPTIGHGHPRMAGALRARYRQAGIRWVPSLEEVARTATVYAVDNSSTLYELARTRPVIAMNSPEWRRNVSHGLRFWDLIPGPQVDDGEALIATAKRLLFLGETDAERSERDRVMGIVIPRTDGAQEASRLLLAWMSSGPGSPSNSPPRA